jgi:hypothetical protein
VRPCIAYGVIFVLGYFFASVAATLVTRDGQIAAISVYSELDAAIPPRVGRVRRHMRASSAWKK